MKQILKFSVIVLSLCLYSCSTKDDPKQNSSNSDSLNLDFELRSPNNESLPAIWSVGTIDAQSVGGENYQISLDDLEKHSGKLSLKMEMSSTPNGKFGAFINALPSGTFTGKTVVFKGWIKTMNVQFVDTQGTVGLWLRADSANTALQFADTYYHILKGDNDWTQVAITMNVNKNATAVYFGGAFEGIGATWFDNLELSVDGTKY